MTTQVYAFAKIDDLTARQSVYSEIKNGKSRFGMWEQSVSLKEKMLGANAFLLRIKEGDWIVHVNMPSYGTCVAVKVTGEYGFDEGIQVSWGVDFNNFLPVDPNSIIEFDRNNPNLLPSVNLAPRRRAQRILAVTDFLTSLENFKEGKFNSTTKEDKSIIHLQEKMTEILPQITALIQGMNKSKEFEKFLNRIFKRIPHTVSVSNGFGFRTDHGADLLVEFGSPVIGINVSTKIVVQAKSYSGQHSDTSAVDQIVHGIKEYDADAGLLITTGEETEVLEYYLRKKSEEIGKTIDLIAGKEVAKFVLRYAPELLLGN